MSTRENIICVIGDSFAGHRSNSPMLNHRVKWSWVSLLEKQYETRGDSFPGQSFWHQRRWFYQNQIDNKSISDTVLIFCHTNSYRLPHKENIPVTSWVLYADPNSSENELFYCDPDRKLFNLAKSFYSSDLYVENFYAFALYSWLAELPALTKNYKKVIHFFGFDDGLSNLPNSKSQFCVRDLVTDNSVVVPTELKSLHMAEKGHTKWGGPDLSRANHFNQHNNLCMFNEICHIIENVPGGSVYSIDTKHWDLSDRSLVQQIKLHKSL